MKRIAVVLSGCGFKDGSEITEAVSALVALGREGASYSCYAPDMTFTSVDHLTGQAGDLRHILAESARICRGHISPLSSLDDGFFDALVFPGGFGAALHLCDWARKGAHCRVHPEVEKAITRFHDNSKPIGAICIAPVLVAKVLGKENVTVTIGRDATTAAEIQKTGAVHETCAVTEFISDRDHKVLTTPAYMYDDASPFEVFTGIGKMIKELVEMA